MFCDDIYGQESLILTIVSQKSVEEFRRGPTHREVVSQSRSQYVVGEGF
jgi:hypothetical protein